MRLVSLSALSVAGSLWMAVACTRPGPGEPKPEPKPEPEPAASGAAEPGASEDPGPGEDATAPKRADVDGFFWVEGAPSPRSCSVAADCLGDTIPALDQPCCNNPQSLEAYARSYRQWVHTWRTDHCEGITCPPPPPPARPPDCKFVVDCVAGQCVDTCP